MTALDEPGAVVAQAARRSLRLPGMADMLGQRLAQVAAGGLGHAELLALLVGDEQTRRDSTGLSRRLAGAHDPPARSRTTTSRSPTDPGWHDPGPDQPSAPHRRGVNHPARTGRGRQTMIAQALGQLACRRGHVVLFTKTSRLLADLSGGHADRTWNTRLKHWARPALLTCDDFAMRELTLPQADDLYELVTERAGRSLIITSNRTPADWYPLFPNPVVAESILDRLLNTAFHIPMPGRSYQPSHRPGTTSTSGNAGRGGR